MREYPEFYLGTEDGVYDLSYHDPKVYHRFMATTKSIKTYKADAGPDSAKLAAAMLGFAFEGLLQNILTKQRSDFLVFFNDPHDYGQQVPDDYKMVARLLAESGVEPGSLSGIDYTTNIKQLQKPLHKNADSCLGKEEFRKKPKKEKTTNTKEPKTDLAVIAHTDNGPVRIGISQKNSAMTEVPFHSGSIDEFCDALRTDDADRIRRVFKAMAFFEDGSGAFKSGEFYSLLDRSFIVDRFPGGKEAAAALKHDIEEAIPGDEAANAPESIIGEYVMPLLRRNFDTIARVAISGKGFSSQTGIETADWTLKRDRVTGKTYLRTCDEYIEELKQRTGKLKLEGNPSWHSEYILLEDGEDSTFPLIFERNPKSPDTMRLRLPTLFER